MSTRKRTPQIIINETGLLKIVSLRDYFKYLGEQLFTTDRFGDKACEEPL
jgi:hypothetical protein